MMRTFINCSAVIALVLAANVASAQVMLPPYASRFNPLPPAAPPPPNISVPVVPQLDAPVRPNYASAPPPSFSDRANNCLIEGAAAGVSGGALNSFTRTCANTQ